MTPSIKKENWCVSLIMSVEIINHHWELQLIIFKSCEEKWQTQDKSTGSSDERVSAREEKYEEERILQIKSNS